MKEITGTGVALCTPFKQDGSIDYAGLEKLVQSNIDGGVDYLVALGTTAETATLKPDEKKAIVDCILKTNAGKLPVVIGIGGNDTRAVADQINATSLHDFVAVLSVSPFYNRPNQDGIYAHYSYLAEQTDAPIIMYNVPGRTGSNMAPETTIRLAEKYPSLVAIKDAPLHFSQYLQLLQNKPEHFQVISGDDGWALSAVIAGAVGTISVIGQGLPEMFSEMIRQGLNRQVDAAYKTQYKIMRMIDLIFKEGNPAGIKALLKAKGIAESYTRLPLTAASDQLQKEITLETKELLIEVL